MEMTNRHLPIGSTGELELARDPHLSPVFHFDPDTNKPYGAWVPDPTRPYLDCHAGDIAHYHTRPPTTKWRLHSSADNRIKRKRGSGRASGGLWSVWVGGKI